MLAVAESNGSSTIDMSDIQKSIRNLYDYNVMLRDKLVDTQSTLRALTTKNPSLASENQTWYQFLMGLLAEVDDVSSSTEQL